MAGLKSFVVKFMIRMSRVRRLYINGVYKGSYVEISTSALIILDTKCLYYP